MKYDINQAAAKLGISVHSLNQHIQVFFRDFNGNFEKIKGNILSTDYDRIYFEFHRLKSTFKMISAPEAEDLCKKCCDFAHAGKPFDYDASLGEISLLFEKLMISICGV